MNIQTLNQRIQEIDQELAAEYEDGETCWAANLEAERERLENAVCILEENGLECVESMTLLDIQWDTDDPADLPEQVLIDINLENIYLLEDLDQGADRISDFLSDTYGYCHFGFHVQVNGLSKQTEGCNGSWEGGSDAWIQKEKRL